MSHSCPECGQACYCGGDIEDHDTGADLHCEHYLECESNDDTEDAAEVLEAFETERREIQT